ncbi:MAG TPA: TlyA family RNA methyltransferase [Oscillospiraceae bacterium]|nr:TlyA family RNA methyltransferase [Oscillospiraceae bacterium]
MAGKRLDMALCERGLAESRARAQALVMEGVVFVDGQRAVKAGTAVPDAAHIEVRGRANPYVSRGGLKLEKALDTFGISPAGRVCLDSGASTGGFTDCLLRRGALKVYAVDVGYGQLAWSLRSDPRVVCMERTNLRHLTKSEIAEDIGLATLDLSFISLGLILPAVYGLLAPAGEAVCLVKPQFEAGKEKVGKKGVVRDPAVHREVLERFLETAGRCGFGAADMTFSPVRGPEGNIEYLARLVKNPQAAWAGSVAALVEASHKALEE